MQLKEKLQLIKNTEKQLQQIQDKIYNALEPFNKINADIYDRKEILDVLMKNNYNWVEIKIVGSNWDTGETCILGCIDLNEQEINALHQALEQTIDTKLKDVDFQQITELYNNVIKINKIEKR